MTDGEGPHVSCLAGAVGIDLRMNQLRESGLDVVTWEDHSRLLAELTARIVWNGGSLKRSFGSPAAMSARRGELSTFDARGRATIS